MQATFTQGSISRHIRTMTFASMVGLLSLFFVDLMDMYWLSLLGQIELAAAIGYAGSILFFTLSLSIGLSIGCSAIVSQSIGEGDPARTRQLTGNIFLIVVLTVTPICIGVIALLHVMLAWLGAQGNTHSLAYDYMIIVLPSMPLMALAMAASGVMRAYGYAKEAMYLTLIGGAVNALLDPLFIFTFGLGIEGAAIATVLSRFAMLTYGIVLLTQRYKLVSAPALSAMVRHAKEYVKIALPAVLTNLSTPIGVAFVTATMAQFGDDAVAGNAIVGKIQPLAFAGLFALSGSVGPIVGQNLGAKHYARIMETFKQSSLFVVVYTAIACVVLFALTEFLVGVFQVDGDAAQLIRWFCWGLSTMFVFAGFTFCTNAMFNNLRVAHWATAMNFAKATIFTMPFAYWGGVWGGPVGIWVGIYIGAAIVGMAGMALAYWKIKQLMQLE